jgi:hypothetical protein
MYCFVIGVLIKLAAVISIRIFQKYYEIQIFDKNHTQLMYQYELRTQGLMSKNVFCNQNIRAETRYRIGALTNLLTLW